MNFVIDANVLIVANNQSPQADLLCQQNCIEFLSDVRRSHCILLDDQYRIMREYTQNLDPRLQPGVGFAFFKWLHTHKGSSRCREVLIQPRNVSLVDFVEFPADPALNFFDPGDRKYVAVVIASKQVAEITNAVDSDWAHHAEALQQNGITVRFLCTHQCKP